MSNNQNNASLIDYFAGAMLSSGTVWFWIQAVMYFQNSILKYLSYPVYILAEALASYLVIARNRDRYLSTGIKTAILSWILAMFFALSFNLKSEISFAIVVLVCFLIGGFIGAYIALQARLRVSSSKGKFD